MPFYRIRGCMVHLKLSGPKSKHPKPCVALIPDPRVIEGIGRRPSVRCLCISEFLCDWPVEGGTCDAPLCAEHATDIGQGRHLCPTHAPRRDELPGQKGLF